jgi:phytoene synthase
MSMEAARARDWFRQGFELLPLLDRRSRACVTAMAGIYWRVLGRIEKQPSVVLSTRVSLPAHEKAWVAVRSLVGASP